MAHPTETASVTTTDSAPATREGLGAIESADTSPESGVTVSSEAPASMDSPAAPLTGGAGAAATTDEPSFFDPSDLTPDLMPAYKQMQRAFTQKTQEIAKGRDKIKAYDAALGDPRGTIEMLARQYGIPVNFGNQPSNGAAGTESPEWEPQNWNEVLERARDEAKADVMREMQPFIGNMQRSQLERDLDDIVGPTWREYEDRFVDTMRTHPTLAGDASALARMALPSEVQEARAMQKALKQLERRGEGNKSKPGSSLRKPEAAPVIKNFNDAYEAAKKQIAARGRS